MTVSQIEILPADAERDRQHAIWRQVDLVKRLSDRVVGVGPFGLGLDGVLTIIPGVGGLYSLGAGGFLIAQAVRSRASGFTIGRMAAYLLVDLATSEVPLVGDALDVLFPAHLMAARALQKDIERRHGPPEKKVSPA
jgi:hypothetical protein